MEAFSDGVLAIIITIMVLEIKVPETGEGRFSDLLPFVPKFLSYLLSFVYVGLYWNNHHHMLQSCKKVNGKVLWANLHLLFWLSLFPFTTAWVGEHHDSSAPLAIYGLVLLMAAFAWIILLQTLIDANGRNNILAKAVENKTLKEKISPFIYLAGIVCSFFIPWLAIIFYTITAIIWIVPDQRIERALNNSEAEG
ncbi:Uncharacterized membrane protein [Arachidicoccus rhizosphaerae]|uniref:Uncharacterized membrane protein n=2 Tax=Arachidicoccus rhizosphaerae TaxID=551991 RepID=A0A1H3VJA2_9BACT|nr:Uncharacterized membrane protein [Arachidicoccus rhizosphaerae]